MYGRSGRLMLLPHRSWPELLMHVLAHVPSALPSSVYDDVYIGWAAERLGSASDRQLGEDAVMLAQMLSTHQALSQVQLLGWLFDQVEQATVVATQDLAVLGPAEVSRPQLLPHLVELGPAPELLRCAAALEAEAWATLPALASDDAAVRAALEQASAAAPSLVDHGVLRLRALRLRGRLFDDEIWVGSAELGVDEEHVAWQAAHEATVADVSRLARSDHAERAIEHVAVVLLAERAHRAGLGDNHQRWLAHLDLGVDDSDRTSLDGAATALLERCHRVGPRR